MSKPFRPDSRALLLLWENTLAGPHLGAPLLVSQVSSSLDSMVSDRDSRTCCGVSLSILFLYSTDASVTLCFQE